MGIATTLADVNYSPMVLAYRNEKLDRHWELNFKEKPVKVVELTGDTPTRDEIIECLSATNAPVWFIPICEIIIVTILERRM